MYHRSPQEVAYLAVACRGPSHGTVKGGPAGRRRSKDGANLQFTTADANLFREDLAGYVPEPGEPDRGDLPREQLLLEPTIAELLGAVHLATLYVERCSGTKYWRGGGLALFYSGHGTSRTGALVLRDGEISGRDFADLLAGQNRTADGTALGVELILDSCHSVAFIADFLVSTDRVAITPRDMWAASLHDELAWELDELGHGALTFSLLYPGNAHVDHDVLAEAVNKGDDAYIRSALKSFVPNAVTNLTERDQHEVRLTNGHYLEVVGAGACELGDADGLTGEQILDALERAARAKPRAVVNIGKWGE